MVSDANLERANAKQRQIADAARSLFLAQGYAGTSMDAVAGLAGVSKQTLYRYFPSKTDLLIAVLADAVGFAAIAPSVPQDTTAASAAMDGAHGPQRPGTAAPSPAVLPDMPAFSTLAEVHATLFALARGVTHRLMAPEGVAFLRLLIGEAFRMDEVRAAFRQSLPEQFIFVATSILRSADAAGVLRVPRPELSARAFIGPIFSFVAIDGFFNPEPSPPPSDDDLGFLVDAFLLTVRADG